MRAAGGTRVKSPASSTIDRNVYTAVAAIRRSMSKKLKRTMAMMMLSGIAASAITAASCSHHSRGTRAVTRSVSRTGTSPM